jgi:hypothetical protein
MTDMNEHDQRQYQLMKQCIKGFEVGNLNLRVVIDSLKGLLNALEETSSAWKHSFNVEWWTLEEIYALASDREQEFLSQEDQEDVYKALENMKNLLELLLVGFLAETKK